MLFRLQNNERLVLHREQRFPKGPVFRSEKYKKRDRSTCMCTRSRSDHTA